MKTNSEKYEKELVEIFMKVSKDKDLLEAFLKDILTPREFETISIRWQIVKRLAKGEHHQSIAEDLRLGVATVTRGSREMRNRDGGFRRTLKLLK